MLTDSSDLPQPVSNDLSVAPAIRLPGGPRLPTLVVGAFVLFDRHRATQWMRRRYGAAVTVNIPMVGRTVVISDPALVRQLFMTSADIAGYASPNLGDVLGAGSTFSLEGEEHRRRRKLLMPPFHGRRMRQYEAVVEEETLRELATWPHDAEFAVLPSTMRITLNTILRTVFGVQGAELDELRVILPDLVEAASVMAVLPLWARRDLGPRSPRGRLARARRRYDDAVDRLMDARLADPGLAARSDVLSLLLQARYDDGTPLSRGHVADELLTLLAAGHETTATTLAWAVERLRRHPELLRRLVQEVDEGGTELRQATVVEVQRVRPVIDGTSRRVVADSMPLGEWTVPRGCHVTVSISGVHDDETLFPDPLRFDPDRFVGVAPSLYEWVPFGGGTRRCVGAAFATMEMDVVLRVLLQHYELAPTDAPDESWHSRGVAFAPGRGGLAVVRPRPEGDRY